MVPGLKLNDVHAIARGFDPGRQSDVIRKIPCIRGAETRLLSC